MIDFEDLEETIGSEKFEHYGFGNWTQDQWDLYQEFIVDVYNYDFCAIREKMKFDEETQSQRYVFEEISKFPEFQPRKCDEVL